MGRNKAKKLFCLLLGIVCGTVILLTKSILKDTQTRPRFVPATSDHHTTQGRHSQAVAASPHDEDLTQSVPQLDLGTWGFTKLKTDDACHLADGGQVLRMVEHEGTNVAYCVTPKVGCTFWLSVFRWLHNDTLGKTYSDPFDMPRYQVHYVPHHMKYYRFNSISTSPEFMSQRFRFMFVREPYARLWSAYVDKFLLPDYWNVDGWKVTRKRRRASPLSRRCGHDVTFAEFVQHVTSTPAIKLNDHYRPYQHVCSPCVFKPHVIGKMETFQQDSRYVLQRMNLTGLDSKLGTSEQRALHEMAMLIDDAFHETKSYPFFRGCTNSTHLATRLWQAFQINGYLPATLPFPWIQHPHVDRVELKTLVRNAYEDRRPKDPAFWRAQKEQAMVDAYSLLDDSVLAKLRSVYEADFTLFGYDPFLEVLYRGRRVRDTRARG